MKRLSSGAAALALIVVVSTPLVPAQGPPPALVETSTVTSERITESVVFTGTVRAILDSLVASEVSGRVAK